MFSLSPAKWTRILVPIAAGLLLLAAACGDDDATPEVSLDATEPPVPTEPTLVTQPDSPQEIDSEVTEAVDGILQTAVEDNFYTLNNLKVPLNETTTIEIVNDGSEIHNMRIAGPDGEFNTDDDSVSDPEQITAGSTATVEFTPTLAGTYTFRCDFHTTEQGGVIVVE